MFLRTGSRSGPEHSFEPSNMMMLFKSSSSSEIPSSSSLLSIFTLYISFVMKKMCSLYHIFLNIFGHLEPCIGSNVTHTTLTIWKEINRYRHITKRLEIQQIYVKIPEFSLKIKTPTALHISMLFFISKFCTVDGRWGEYVPWGVGQGTSMPSIQGLTITAGAGGQLCSRSYGEGGGGVIINGDGVRQNDGRSLGYGSGGGLTGESILSMFDSKVAIMLDL